MKKIKLPINTNVTFNEEEHTYTLSDGTKLSGITSIIHKYLFPCMYDGVNPAVLEAARDRGHAIHKALEHYLVGKAAYRTDFEYYKELDQCGSLIVDNGIKPIAAEYLVSDDTNIATCIDLVAKTKDGIVLIDHKTTGTLYMEYLQWQLSIEAVLFEAQTNLEVKKLYATHLPKNGDAKLVEITRLPNEYVFSLIKAFVNDDLLFENPLHILSDDTDELIKQYRDAEMSMLELKASLKYYEDIQANVKARLKEQMDAEDASKWENESVVITRSKDSVRRTFKLDLMKQIAIPEVTEWLEANAEKCYAETKVAGNVTIKFK